MLNLAKYNHGQNIWQKVKNKAKLVPKKKKKKKKTFTFQ